MNVRVTGQTQTNNAISYLRQQTAAQAKWQDQISSGLRVKLASDDPSQFPTLARAKADSARFKAYGQTMSDATAGLNAGVAALQDVSDVLSRANQIGLEGANATTGNPDFEALATEVDGLIGRMMSAANTEMDGKYVFGGTAVNTPPFRAAATDAEGRPTAVAYDGSADRARAVIGPGGQTVDTRYAGDQVFQQAGADVFQTMIGLRDDLRSAAPNGQKSAALNQRLGELTAARDAVGGAMAEQSANLANLDALQSRMTELKLNADSRVADIAGTDYAEAVVKMQEQEGALQATMAVSAKLLEPSLLDFIR